MTAGGQTASRLSVAWLTAALAMATVVGMRLELSFDLSAFFPSESTLSHDILVEQIQRGPASRLFVIGLGGADAELRQEASERMRAALAESPLFAAVTNGEFDPGDAAIPDIVRRYYPLLDDLDYGIESLSGVMQSRLRDLAFGGGRALGDIIAIDPYLATLDILSALAPAEIDGGPWVAPDGRAVVMAETWASSIDTDAQRAAMQAIGDAFSALPAAGDLELDVTGVGAFGIELEQAIRAEAAFRSAAASVALVLVLLLVFRRLRLVLLSTLPLGMGFLAGLAMVSAVFDSVHGITLAFGFTMLGVAIDYPLHLFSHAAESPGSAAMSRIWPTMRLGVTSTVIAYLALVFAGSGGLAQLGAFTVTGVIVAALVTRTWLPPLLGEHTAPRVRDDGGATAPRLSFAAGGAVFATALGVLLWTGADGLWDDDLSSLSPVPAARLEDDRVLRSATATADMRYQLVLHDTTLDTLLSDCERLETLLGSAAGDGLVDSWQSPCQLLPGRDLQLARQARIPPADELRRRIAASVAATPFRPDAFEPFVENAARTRELGVLTPADFADSPLKSWLDAHLVDMGGRWVALVSLVNPDPERLAAVVPAWPVDAELVDLKAASVELMRDYRSGATRVIGVAALLILLLFWLSRQRVGQTAWVATTVAAAVAGTVAVTSLVHGGLTVMHLVALLLVLGLGLDYALFLGRTETEAERRFTDRGVFACAASTSLAFGILALSSIPVLGYLGLTVATGSAASYAIAWLGSRPRRRD